VRGCAAAAMHDAVPTGGRAPLKNAFYQAGNRIFFPIGRRPPAPLTPRAGGLRSDDAG
jgi:hypothetical protein